MPSHSQGPSFRSKREPRLRPFQDLLLKLVAQTGPSLTGILNPPPPGSGPCRGRVVFMFLGPLTHLPDPLLNVGL
eukprot:5266160-Pyramimonas_sp.AAC.1